MADTDLKGVDQLLQKLDGLKYDMRLKGGRFALRRAAQVVRDAAKQNAAAIDDPETAANISKNIVERWNNRRFKKNGDLAFRVGILGGAGIRKTAKATENSGPGGDTRHWFYVEFGTEDTPATSFMRRAGEESAQKATDAFVSEYSKSIERALKRGKK